MPFKCNLQRYTEAFALPPYNCLCLDDEMCNRCLNPATEGMQITRKTPTNAFTVFLHNTGQDSKAAEARISDSQYELFTVGTNSYPEQAPYMVKGKGQFWAKAGQTSAFTIQAINRFGYQQSFTNEDNFTATITGPGFPALDETQDCAEVECASDPVANPNDMPTYPIMLGPTFRDYGAAGGINLELVDPREAVFPNVHDERYNTKTRDPLDPAGPPAGGDGRCNTNGQTTDYMELNTNRNKCVRRLSRPTFIAGSRGQ